MSNNSSNSENSKSEEVTKHEPDRENKASTSLKRLRDQSDIQKLGHKKSIHGSDDEEMVSISANNDDGLKLMESTNAAADDDDNNDDDDDNVTPARKRPRLSDETTGKKDVAVDAIMEDMEAPTNLEVNDMDVEFISKPSLSTTEDLRLPQPTTQKQNLIANQDLPSTSINLETSEQVLCETVEEETPIKDSESNSKPFTVDAVPISVVDEVRNQQDSHIEKHVQVVNETITEIREMKKIPTMNEIGGNISAVSSLQNESAREKQVSKGSKMESLPVIDTKDEESSHVELLKSHKTHVQKSNEAAEQPPPHVPKKWFLSNFASHLLSAFLVMIFVIFSQFFHGYFVSHESSLSPPLNHHEQTNLDMTHLNQPNHPMLLPPSNPHSQLTNYTLRQYLTNPEGFHLALAPAFFGFYAYFGALIVFDEQLQLLPNSPNSTKLLKSVAGASAGAMAASLIGIGINPREAAEYVSTFNLSSFSDPPGFLGVMRGKKFEDILRENMRLNHGIQRLRRRGDEISPSIQIEDSLISVAVTVFDLLTMKGKIMSKGDMAQATRASATFPGLFQPVFTWENNHSLFPSSILIDGGINDQFGLRGLRSTMKSSQKERAPYKSPKRVVNLSVGSLTLNPKVPPPGPSDLEAIVGQNVESVVSISLMNTPQCGPWAMSNGARAAEAARRAMELALDSPMYMGKEEGHYEVYIDATLSNLSKRS